jgi:hypothetical protein
MTALKVYGRERWHARPPRGELTPQSPPLEAFLHHGAEGDAARMIDLAHQAAAMRATQNMHMDESDPLHGWRDIGYHLVIFQPAGTLKRARAFEGRPADRLPAAQLGHNPRTLAICVYGNLEHELVHATTVELIAQLIRTHPTVKTLGGHGQVTPTSCPGRHGREAIPRIANAAGVRIYRR